LNTDGDRGAFFISKAIEVYGYRRLGPKGKNAEGKLPP